MAALSYVIALPSRGLIHSRTLEALDRNQEGAARAGHFYYGRCLTHDLPMPAAHERVAGAALATDADTIWFLEEDVIPPPDALLAMMAKLQDGYGIAAVDYPVGGLDSGWGCIVRDPSGEILHVGLGCTLIGRFVFEALQRPWFTDEWRYERTPAGGLVRLPASVDPAERYGQHDIGFCLRAREAGFLIGQAPGLAQHAWVERYGAQGTNVGMHQIALRTRIDRQWPG